MKLAIKHNLQVFASEDAFDRPEDALVLAIADAEAAMGETIESFLARVQWHFDLQTVCIINGEFYSRDEWRTKAFAANDTVEFVSRPQGAAGGGGGSSAKTIGAIVAMVALTALAPWAMGAIGLTGTMASIGSSLLIAGGAMAISHFLKPKAGGKTDAKEELFSFGFGGNQARPLQPVPVGYGRTLSFPDFAAPKYSEYDGDNMTEYALLSLGCGDYDVEEVRIGDTRIWSKSGGTNPAFPGITVRRYSPGEKVTLFPVNVVTNSEVSGIELTTSFTPGFVANAVTTEARELLFDFVFPGGVYNIYKDKMHPTTVQIIVDARRINDAGAPTGSWHTILQKNYTYAKQSQIRVTERVSVSLGRYEVRARRTTDKLDGRSFNNGKVTGADNVIWSALRAHIDGPNTFPRTMTLAVRATASEALQGITNAPIGVIMTRIIPVWEGGALVNRPSRSIAWAALDMWRNGDYGAGLPLSQIDFQSFVAYDALWTGMGHTFDHVFKEPQSLDDALETILKAGRAMHASVGDRLTIVRDEPRGIPRMMFTDYDIVRGSLSVEYILANDDLADGIIGEYIDATTFKLAQVSSAPDNMVLAKPSRVQLPGVTHRPQAAGLVRFMEAENQKRRVMVTWTARAEGRLLKRGDLVVVSSEEPETWGQSAEIVDYLDSVRRITFDQPLRWDYSALNHYIEIRRRDGQPWGPVRVSRGTADNIAIVNGADAISEASRQGMSLADAIARSDRMDKPTAAFSPGEPRSFRVLITEGTPDTDGEHITLTGVEDDPEVYTVTETGVPPLPTVPDVFASSIPVVVGLGAQVYQRGMSLVLQAGWQPARGALTYRADISYDSGASWLRAYEGEMTTMEAIVAGSPTIMLRVCAVMATGTPGSFTVVELNSPSLIADNEFFIMKLRPDDLIPELSRKLDSLEIVGQLADVAGETTMLAYEANDVAEAAVKQIATVKVDTEQAIAQLETSVSAKFEEAEVSVNERFQAVADITGQVVGAYTVTVNSGGYFGGFQLVGANGPGGFTSELKIAVDKFLIGAPGSGFGDEAVFGVQTRNGVARVTMRGDFIADGSVNANQINVINLSALSANMGTLTAGVISLTGAAGRIEIWD